MSKLVSFLAGASLLGAGGLLGWSAHSCEPRPVAHGAGVDTTRMEAELAQLRTSLTLALERVSTPAAPGLDTGAARVPVPESKFTADTVASLERALRQFELLVERWERASTRGAQRLQSSDGLRFVPDPTALEGVARVEDIGATFDAAERLWVGNREQQPLNDLVARLEEVYRFWTLDQVLELHGRPDEVHDHSGQLTIVYRRAPGSGAKGRLNFSITGGRVVSTSYELD